MDETNWIQRYIVPLVHAPGADRLRDDVALLSVPGPTIATMDTLVESVHFLSYDPLETVGQKLIRVNASDILAKGAVPSEVLLSIAWPNGPGEADFSALIAGVARDLQEFKIALIGGDLVGTSGPLTLTVAMTGVCINSAPVRRSSGKAGQNLWISGEIGWGGAGLAAAKNSSDPETALRYQVPRIGTLGAAQTVADVASASIDISDGLLIDALRLAHASECGALIELERVPLATPTNQIDLILSQCSAGDDYQILMSADGEQIVHGFTKIGKLTDSAGLTLTHHGQTINAPSTLGFEH